MLTYASGELPPRRVFREPADGREDQHLQRLTSPTRHRHSRTYDSYGPAYRYVGPLRRAQGVCTDIPELVICVRSEWQSRARACSAGERERVRETVCVAQTRIP